MSYKPTVITSECKGCGQIFNHSDTRKIYCSHTCRDFYQRAKIKDKIILEYKKICKFCLKNFKTDIKDQLYCSKECSYKYHHKPIEKIETKCIICEKKFYTHRKNQKICSEECREIYLKNIWLFTGNSSSYHWLQLRFNVMKRDNFTCKYCGRNVIEDKIKIHIDHIQPRNFNGEDEMDNLVASCQECNLGKADCILEKRQKDKLKEYIFNSNYTYDEKLSNAEVERAVIALNLGK